MNKRDFFLAAMRADEYRRRAWVFSAFALTNEGGEKWKENPYAYRIVQTPAGYFFVDPDNGNQLSPIEGVAMGEPPFSHKERVQLKAGDLPNLKEDIDTTYGRIFFNYVALVWPFHDKLPYINERANARAIEDAILPRLKDTPKEGETRDGQSIYVDEYLNFCDAMFYLAGFTQLCVPAGSEKAMVQAPGMQELRAKLIEENKDRLHDPAVVAKIDAELVAYDKAYLKGDQAEGFFMGKSKSYNIVRKKLFGMHGAEIGLGDGVNVELIQNSLSEGWDISKFPAYNNSLRAGSYNRGRETMLGGESVKWLLRSSSNMMVTEDDCGTKLGIPMIVDNNNFVKLIGFSVVSEKGHIKVESAEDAKSYLGKHIMRRSPMFCKLDKTDFCKVCVGDRLAENPTALSSAVSAYGSAFMDIYMQAGHGKQLVVAHFDFKYSIR
jgi:hypothetical protein